MNKLKLLVIGLDGATYSVLDPLIKRGHLPNIEKVFSYSSKGELESTIPPVTALAWSTFLTGKNPGKHGLLGWQEPLNEQFERPTTNARQSNGPKLWHYLSAAGYKACFSNVPVTYPPEPVDGAIVSGMLTPDLKSTFTYPPVLKEELLEAFPDFVTDIDVRVSPKHRYGLKKTLSFLKEARQATQIRGGSFRWLLDKYKPDVGVFVFELPDRLQHILWKNISQLTEPSGENEGESEIQKELIACYQTLDDEVGKLIDQTNESTYVVFLSDHGFGPIHTTLHINDWLASHGWLRYSTLRSGGWQILRRLGRRFKKWIPGKWVKKMLKTIPLYRTLDWQNTVAYSGSPSEYGIFINKLGREPAGIVTQEAYQKTREDIIKALLTWRDPAGNVVVKKAYKREELYTVPFVDKAPDIVFELESGFYVSDLTSPKPGVFFSDISTEGWGFHEKEGVFAIHGPGVKQGKEIVSAHIADLLPTILCLLAIPIPDDMDGRILEEAFEKDLLEKKFSKLRDVGTIRDWYQDPIDHDRNADDSMVRERLRNLGYLSD